MQLSAVTAGKTNTNFGRAKSAKFVSDKSFKWMENINGVHQRAILGVTALATQPVIDYHNPRADEETRKYSVLKTVVKIVVGAVVGCAVRYGAIKMAEKMVKNPKKLISKVKSPELKKSLKKTLDDPDKSKKFAGNFGTILGIIGVVAADVLIDMPLAKFLIEKSADKFGLTTPEETSQEVE